MAFDGVNYQGYNFAPIRPLQDATNTSKHTRDNPSSLNAFFREVYQEIRARHDDLWREQCETARTIAMLRAGKLVMKRDMGGSGYVFLPPVSTRQNFNRDRSNFPLFPQNSELLKAKWVKASPKVNARSFGEGYKAVIQANLVNTVAAAYFKDIFTPEYELNEAVSAQDYGTYITRFTYDKRLNQQRMMTPIIQNESKVLLEGYGACNECGYEASDTTEFNRDGNVYPQCPKCDSFRMTKMVEPSIIEEANIVDVEEIVQGDLTGRLVKFPACRYDPAVLPHDSSYFLESQYVPMRLARQMFGDIEIHADESNDGLQLIESLTNRGGNIENLGENNLYTSPSLMGERAVFTELFLTEEWYAGVKLDEPEETCSGVIPAGVPLEQVFPGHLCICGWNDFRLQTGYYHEKPQIVGAVYYLQSHSGIGKGVSDSVDISKDLNELHSMAMAGLKRFGAGGVFYDKDAATPEEIRNLFKPHRAVPLDLQKNGGGNINNVVGQLQSQPVNPALAQYAIQLSNLLNMTLLTGDFTQGMVQDVDINTFGGQQLAHAKAEEQKGAIFTMKVFHREKSAEAIIDLFRTHIKLPKYFSVDADRQGATKGKWISGEELPENIRFDAIPDSEIPVNSFEKRMATRELIEKSGGIGALIEAATVNPKMTGWYARQFGVNLPMLDEEEIQLVCLARLDSIKQASEVYPDDPMAVIEAIQKPVMLREANHLLKAEFLSEILDDDEVSSWNPVALAAVQLLIERHYEMQDQAAMQDAVRKQRAAFAVQAEAAQMQQAIQQPMVEQQEAAQAEQLELAAASEMANRYISEEEREAEHQRRLELQQQSAVSSER